MDALQPGYLPCPILPKKSVSELEAGGLFTRGPQKFIFKYLIIMQAKINIAFYIL